MSRSRADLRRLIDVADILVDDEVGIVRYVGLAPRRPGEPDFFEFTRARLQHPGVLREKNFANTGGASTDRDLAMAKAIGEAVERYCGAIFDVEDLPARLGGEGPLPLRTPRRFALYGEDQLAEPGFPWVPFEVTTPVRWVPAIDPLGGGVWHVPAAMVFVPYFYYQGSGDTPIVQPISTGLACHASPAEAAIGGLCEVIERDAFTIAWQARLSLPRVPVETLDEADADLVQRFVRTGNDVTILDARTDVGVPTFLSVLRGTSPSQAAIAVAGATDPDPERALRKSLEELEHTRRYSQQMKSDMERLVPEPDHGNVVDQVTHLNFWCDHANAHLADFLTASRAAVSFREVESLSTGDARRDLATLAERVRAIGHRALLVDVTTPDVASLGLSVVRGLIPGFHPLFMGFRTRAKGGRRLWEVPARLGHRGITRASGDNPAPHAYP